jgi:UDP-4-amino-4,6-dideoxy-N-acetyl-beta-L-altrosamine transaminase
MIPYGKQSISKEDIEAVVSVLKSDYLTQGPLVPEFEREVCEYVSSQHAVAVNSGTSALHVACLALGLTEDDWLWTSPNTFVASANCALYCGANISFVDIDTKTYNLCAGKLEKKLIEAKAKNKLPKIVVPVHFAGQSCEMEKIFQLSLKYGFKIIEDASHAIGGKYKGKLIGGGQYSDITVFSFHPVKIITTGEGGMALTNSAELANKMKLLRSHGVTRDELDMTNESDGPWYYQQHLLGLNYRMTDIQAALGKSQLERIETFVSERHALAKRYDEKLTGLPLTKPFQHKDNYSAYHLYPIVLALNLIKKSKKQIFEELRNKGIGVNVHYIPVHTQPYYKNLGFEKGNYPESEAYYEKTITIPLFHKMTTSEQDYVISQLVEILT